MRVDWHVVDAVEDAIRVQQTIEQIRATLTTPGASADFDSGARTRATGLAKQLAESLQPLMGAEIEIVFTPLGEVRSAKPANEAAQKLFAVGDAVSGNPAAASRPSLTQLFERSIVRLPEMSVAAGDSWTVEDALPSAALELSSKTTYTLDEIVEQDNARMAKISFASHLAEQQAREKRAVRTQSLEASGSVLFSIEEGRPVAIERRQRLVTERNYRDSKIDVALDSRGTMKFGAESAKK
jgi:hypothetical protein